ncbi:MAG: hypothetical protein KGY99_05715 [Phycisphaerae bacterium]|nr:hypothetical protein [Phycisphaerae bacterium]
MIAVHVTHEAVEQMGGIGAVIAGLGTARAYDEAISRTVLLGPLMRTDQPVNRRLGEGGKLLYSSLDAIHTAPWSDRFRPIERTYDVGVTYGTRPVRAACSNKTVEAEVLLLDVFHANRDRLNLFKGELYRKFAVPSDQFEHTWEYEQYVRLAEPGFEALKAIGCDESDERVVILAHEYMGMPTALKAVLSGGPNTRTVFYAHEVASVRPVVETAPGHDTMFYNVLPLARRRGQWLEDVFDEVVTNFKHPLVKAARYCDHVFAVGDRIRDELCFVDPHFETMGVDLVYNGIPAGRITRDQRTDSRERLARYAERLFGDRPTWLFSHVCRPVVSKGIWRDLAVLDTLESLLARRGETCVYFMLGTLAGKRRTPDVRQMERVYGWPVYHEHGYPDLCGGEEQLGEMFDIFNRDREACRAVLVNQWGWSRDACGDRMPAETTFADLRRGTDLEFGLSVYEPFGISQFEPLASGALCAVSNVCGCMGLARREAGADGFDDNIIVGDFLHAPEGLSIEQLVSMPVDQRDAIEADEAARLAEIIDAKLPRDEDTIHSRMAQGQALAERMSWEHVVSDYILPSLQRASET